MMSLTASQGCNSLKYQSEYDSTYIYIPDKPVSETISIQVSCAIKKCAQNQYKLNGQCMQCPDDKPRASIGSTSILKCFSCPPGTDIPHHLSDTCTLSDKFGPFAWSNGWRIWVPEYHTISGSRWGVKLLEFYSTQDCTGTPYEPKGEAVDSDNFGTPPETVFNGLGAWSGKQGNDGSIWLGMVFAGRKLVQCVKVVNTSNSVKEIRVQALVKGQWRNTLVQKDLDLNSNIELILSFDHPPTSAPTQNPTPMPTSEPTKRPTRTPTKPPTKRPTISPAPTGKPVINVPVPTKSPVSNNCDEQRKDRFLKNVKANGNPVTRNCNWLKQKGSKVRTNLCNKNISMGSFRSGKL